MTTRLDFLKQSALLTGSTLLFPYLPKSLQDYEDYQPGLQLYTVRNAMKENPKKTLEHVANIGYVEVEGATYSGNELYYGMKSETFKKVLDNNGLTMPSNHYLLGSEKLNGQFRKGTILHDWERAIEDAVQIDQKYMVCAYLPNSERKSLDDYKRIADYFNKVGEMCHKAGIQFCYHNHNFEFQMIDGEIPYQVLLNNTDEKLVKMEMDVYWVVKGNHDPIALFKEQPRRFPLWHIKDMDDTSKHFFTEIGNGIIDFKKIFSHANLAGMKHFFVEQDECPGSPFKSITQSIRYLEKNILS